MKSINNAIVTVHLFSYNMDTVGSVSRKLYRSVRAFSRGIVALLAKQRIDDLDTLSRPLWGMHMLYL